MKKVIFILMSVICLSACKKSENTSGNTTVEYKYNGDVSTTFTITYTDASGTPVSVQATGTSWDKKISTSQAMGFTWADFGFIVNAAVPPTLNGTMFIYVNGRNVDEQIVTMSPATGLQDFNFHVVVFK